MARVDTSHQNFHFINFFKQVMIDQVINHGINHIEKYNNKYLGYL